MARYNHSGLTIVATNVCPPIPSRAFDWSAYVDEWGADDSPQGFGATEAEAVADLREKLAEM